MTSSMQFASCFLHSFVVLESEVIQPSSQGRAKRYVATIPVPEFDCSAGSIERQLLESSVSNDNVAASVSWFFPLNMKLYVPGCIIYVSGKFVSPPGEPFVMDASIHFRQVR
jgi:hypothetical protein